MVLFIILKYPVILIDPIYLEIFIFSGIFLNNGAVCYEIVML